MIRLIGSMYVLSTIIQVAGRFQDDFTHKIEMERKHSDLPLSVSMYQEDTGSSSFPTIPLVSANL